MYNDILSFCSVSISIVTYKTSDSVYKCACTVYPLGRLLHIHLCHFYNLLVDCYKLGHVILYEAYRRPQQHHIYFRNPIVAQ